jgi:hypothetical protein
MTDDMLDIAQQAAEVAVEQDALAAVVDLDPGDSEEPVDVDREVAA